MMELRQPFRLTKKQTGIIIGTIIGVLLVGLVLIKILHKPANIRNYCVSDEEYNEICSARKPAVESKDLSLLLNENEIYLLDNELWCSLGEDELKKTKWNFYSLGTGVLRLAISESAYNECSIEKNIPLVLLIYTETDYVEYPLHLSSLPFFFLESEYEIEEKAVEVTANGYSGKAKMRGNSSRYYPKKSYDIELKKACSFEGMQSGNDWVLKSLFNDQERVRDCFCTNLWNDSCAGDNQFGVNNGYELKYVELFINGKYEGLYALGYKPNQKHFEIKNGEFLFKKKIGYLMTWSAGKQKQTKMLHGWRWTENTKMI